MPIYKYDVCDYVKDACCPDRDMLAELLLATNSLVKSGVHPVIAAKDTMAHPYFDDIRDVIDEEAFTYAVAQQNGIASILPQSLKKRALDQRKRTAALTALEGGERSG